MSCNICRNLAYIQFLTDNFHPVIYMLGEVFLFLLMLPSIIAGFHKGKYISALSRIIPPFIDNGLHFRSYRCINPF